MGRFILRYLILAVLFSHCASKGSRFDCTPFCQGEEWIVQKFNSDPYPAVFPFEENAVVSALEKDLRFWTLTHDSLIFSGRKNLGVKIRFKYESNHDTVFLSRDRYNEINKLLVKERTADNMTLELIGIFHANIYLKKLK